MLRGVMSLKGYANPFEKPQTFTIIMKKKLSLGQTGDETPKHFRKFFPALSSFLPCERCHI